MDMWEYDVITSQAPGGMGGFSMPSFINTGSTTHHFAGDYVWFNYSSSSYYYY